MVAVALSNHLLWEVDMYLVSQGSLVRNGKQHGNYFII